jgi:hypothetical protein
MTFTTTPVEIDAFTDAHYECDSAMIVVAAALDRLTNAILADGLTDVDGTAGEGRLGRRLQNITVGLHGVAQTLHGITVACSLLATECGCEEEPATS